MNIISRDIQEYAHTLPEDLGMRLTQALAVVSTDLFQLSKQWGLLPPDRILKLDLVLGLQSWLQGFIRIFAGLAAKDVVNMELHDTVLRRTQQCRVKDGSEKWYVSLTEFLGSSLTEHRSPGIVPCQHLAQSKVNR